MSEDLYHEIAALRNEAAQLRLKLANATSDALVAAHRRGDELQNRVDRLETALQEVLEITVKEVVDTDDLLRHIKQIATIARGTQS